jgi:diguanylate cyclase (GGDEF)-like protein
LSHKFKKELSTDDFVARLGGDEFVIILKKLDFNKNIAIHKTTEFTNGLLKEICTPVYFDTFKYTPSASIGITFIGGENKEAEEILQEADLAMYHTKEKGKNSFSIFNQTFKVNKHGKRYFFRR